MNDLKNSIISFAETKKQLELLEQSLSSILGISSNVRETLVKMEANHELDNSELVKDWQQTYSSYRDWLNNNPSLALAEKWCNKALEKRSIDLSAWGASVRNSLLGQIAILEKCADELEELGQILDEKESNC